MMNYFGDWPVVWVNVHYRGSDVVFYTSICNDNWEVRVIRSIDNGVVENAHMILDITSLGMEGEPVWIRIYKSLSQRKFFIEGRKGGEEFIILVFHVN